MTSASPAGPSYLLRNPWEQDGDAPYAKLEHQIDEGYGYFGAARAYALRSDEVNRLPFQASAHSLYQQCGDLVFSGHTLPIITLSLTIEKYSFR